MSASEISLPVSHVQPERVHGLRLTGASRTAGIVAWAVVWLISLGAFFLATYVLKIPWQLSLQFYPGL